MTRKCGSCGIPAPDGESKFCNRCGSTIVDEPEPQFPVCGTCGGMVADPEAQFCDKCGGPVRRTLACPACGNPAIDENSKFCTRCGTTFVKPNTCPGCGFPIPNAQAIYCNRCGSPLRGVPPAAAPGSVVVTKKRTTLPVQETAPDWDPWTDGGDEFDARPLAPQEPEFVRQPVAEEPAYRAPQVSVPSKKYSHLPMIADELKGSKGEPERPAKERPAKKKGVLGFMKR
jgi:rRNA maturation endonuclease Nob1